MPGHPGVTHCRSVKSGAGGNPVKEELVDASDDLKRLLEIGQLLASVLTPEETESLRFFISQTLAGAEPCPSQKQPEKLKILAKRIIINPEGRIIDHELHSPFTYLRCIAEGLENPGVSCRDSEQLCLGAHGKSCQRLSGSFRLLKRAYYHHLDFQFHILVATEGVSYIIQPPRFTPRSRTGRPPASTI